MLSKCGKTKPISQYSQLRKFVVFGKHSAWCFSNSNHVAKVCPQKTHIINGLMGLQKYVKA